MTGESLQPGGRPPAPARLALVQAFINTHFDLVEQHGAEILCSPDALGDWLTAGGPTSPATPLTTADLDRALAVRESLRTLAAAGGNGNLRTAALEQLDRIAAGTRVEVRFGAGRAAFRARARGRRRRRPRRSAGHHRPGDRRRLLVAAEDLSGRPLRVGVLRHVAQPHRALVLDVGVRRPRQGQAPLPPPASPGGVTRCARSRPRCSSSPPARAAARPGGCCRRIGLALATAFACGGGRRGRDRRRSRRPRSS